MATLSNSIVHLSPLSPWGIRTRQNAMSAQPELLKPVVRWAVWIAAPGPPPEAFGCRPKAAPKKAANDQNPRSVLRNCVQRRDLSGRQSASIAANLLPILVTLLVYAWVAGSFGVLVGSLIVSEDKVVGLCILVSLIVAALGGCWWPWEIGPDSMKIVAHVVPSGWAMDALHQLISFGGGWRKAAPYVGVLALYGLAAHLAAARCFRY